MGEQAVRYTGGRQLTHTITGREACAGTANIDTDLWAFCCVFGRLSGEILGGWGWRGLYVGVVMTVEGSDELISTSSKPPYQLSHTSSGAVVFSFPVGSVHQTPPPPTPQQRETWKLNQSVALPRGVLLFMEEPRGGSQ